VSLRIYSKFYFEDENLTSPETFVPTFQTTLHHIPDVIVIINIWVYLDLFVHFYIGDLPSVMQLQLLMCVCVCVCVRARACYHLGSNSIFQA